MFSSEGDKTYHGGVGDPDSASHKNIGCQQITVSQIAAIQRPTQDFWDQDVRKRWIYQPETRCN
jgi:hypothetical protein